MHVFVNYRYWYVPTAECIHIMNGHTAAVNAVAVTEDGNKTVSASSDATVKVWNTDQSSRLAEKPMHERAHTYVQSLEMWCMK